MANCSKVFHNSIPTPSPYKAICHVFSKQDAPTDKAPRECIKYCTIANIKMTDKTSVDQG